MKYVQFQFNNGKVVPLKRKMAEHLEYANKGHIVDPVETESPKATKGAEQEAQVLGVDLNTVPGTGRDGQITKRDVLTYRTRMMQAG